MRLGKASSVLLMACLKAGPSSAHKLRVHTRLLVYTLWPSFWYSASVCMPAQALSGQQACCRGSTVLSLNLCVCWSL